MKLLNNLFIGFVFCFLSTMVSAAHVADDHITYKNQRGSIMTLNFHPGEKATEGTLDGTVKLATGDKKADMPCPLTGYYNGNAMAITINFSYSKQIAAMIGHFLDNKNTLHTLSLDALQTKNTHVEDWNSSIIRAGSYTRL